MVINKIIEIGSSLLSCYTDITLRWVSPWYFDATM